MLQVLIHVIQQCHQHVLTHQPPLYVVPTSSTTSTTPSVPVVSILSHLLLQVNSLSNRPNLSQKLKAHQLLTLIHNNASSIIDMILKELNLQFISCIVGVSSVDHVLYMPTQQQQHQQQSSAQQPSSFMSLNTTADLFDRYNRKMKMEAVRSTLSMSSSHTQLSQQMTNVSDYLLLMQQWVQVGTKECASLIELITEILVHYRGTTHFISPNYYRIVTRLLQFLFTVLNTYKCEDKSKESILKMLLLRCEDSKDRLYHAEESGSEIIVLIQSLLETIVMSKYRLRFYKVLKVIHEHETFARNSRLQSSASATTASDTTEESKPNLLTDPFNDRNLQIMLGPLFHYIRMRRDRLKQMVTLSGHYARCPTFLYHLDGFQASAVMLGSIQSLKSSDNDILFAFSASEPKISSVEWNTRVMQLVSMLSQQANPEAFSYMLAQNAHLKELKTEVSKVFAPKYTAKMLNEAIVYRILQILNEKQSVPQAEDMFVNVSQGNIGKWITLADQIYSLISPASDFRQIVVGEPENLYQSINESTMSIRKAVELYGDDVKDHFVLWIILQMVPLYGEYCNPALTEDLLCLVSELMHKKYTSWKPHELELLHYHHQFIMQRLANLNQITFSGRFMSRHVQQWRIESEKALDYYNLDGVARKNLFLLSTYLSQPISQEILKFLETVDQTRTDVDDDSPSLDVTHVPQAGYTNSVVNAISRYVGKRKPLDVNVLLVLSTHSRKKLYTLLEKCIFRQDLVTAVQPSILETFVRITYCSPSFYYPDSKLTLMQSIPLDHSGRFVIMEMLNFRMMRFFKYTNTEKLFVLVSQYMKVWSEMKSSAVNNHRFYLTLENLFLKIILYLVNDLQRLSDFIVLFRPLKTHYTECVRRIVIFTIARILKLRGISAFTSHECTNQLMKTLTEQCSDVFNDIIYSESRMQFFPMSLKSSLTKRKSVQQAKTRPTHLNEIVMSIVQQTYSTTNLFLEKLIANQTQKLEDLIVESRKKFSEEPKYLQSLLSSLWYTIYRSKFELSKPVSDAVKTVLNIAQTAFEYNCNIYRFVNFLLDEFIPSLEKSVDANTGQSVISQVEVLLCKFIWQYEFLPLDTIVQALTDRAGSRVLSQATTDVQTESTYPIPLLKYLLLVDTQFSSRVKYYIYLGVHINHWEEPDYFMKHAKYHDKYPESWGIHFSPGTAKPEHLPSYYGNLCLRMISILDLLLRRLIEVGDNVFFIELMDRYTPLLLYHDFSLSFVKQLFTYYFDTSHKLIFDHAVQKRILQFAIACGANFSPELVMWISQTNSESNNAESFATNYFVQRIRYAASVMPSTTRASANDTCPIDRFKEFSTPFEQRINELVIEILAVPLPLSEKLTRLMNSITACCENPEQFDFINSIDAYRMTTTTGVLLTSLPQFATSNCLVDYLRKYLVTNNNIVLNDYVTMTGEATYKANIQSEQQVGEYLIDNGDTALLSILHTFFGNATIDGINNLKVILQDCNTSIHSARARIPNEKQWISAINLNHVYFFCRLVGPLLHLLQEQPFSKGTKGSLDTIDRLFTELFKSLCYVTDTPIGQYLDSLNAASERTTPLLSKGAKKRTFDEMNESQIEFLDHSTVFQVLNQQLSHQSIPVLQNELSNEARSVIYEQIMDFLHHVHNLVSSSISPQVRNHLIQELKSFCSDPTIQRDLLVMISGE